MNATPCPNCSASLAPDVSRCPHCGAVRSHEAAGYEWKSAATWMGWPLVHVAFGCDAAGSPRVARGVVAIGARAVGGIACGVVAAGGVTLGLISVGVISVGVASFAALAAIGVNAIGPLAFGVVAVGWAGGGVHFLGWKTLFSVTQAVR